VTTTFLFLPPGDGTGPIRWARADDGRVRQGEGLPADAGSVVAVAPADAVTLHWAELPARSLAQATAAARLLAAEASAAPAAELHVAVGDGAGERPIAVAEAGAVRLWVERLSSLGVEATALVPAPMLLPDPGDAWVRAVLGGQAVVRGPGTGFTDEEPLTGIATGGVVPAEVNDADLAAVLAAPPVLDMLQGPFARRRRRAGIDWPLVRRIAALAALVLAMQVAVDAVRLIRYSGGADVLEARADAAARAGLPRGAGGGADADRRLDERLRALRGPGRGFSAGAATVAGAVRAVPGAELTSLAFQPDGAMRLGVAADREAAPTELRDALRSAGLTVDAGTFTSNGGRVTGEIAVAAP